MKRTSVFLGGKLVVGAVLLLLVYHHLSLDDVALEFRRLRLLPLVAFTAILFANTFLSALKWKWLLDADGIQLSIRTLFGSCIIGTFLNLFLPSTVGGDTYRIASIGRGRIVKSTAAVLADRLSGLIALATICTIFAATHHHVVGHRAIVIVPALLLIAQVVLSIALLWPSKGRRLLLRLGFARILPRFASFMERLFLSFQSYRQRPSLLLKILVISFSFQFLFILAIYCLSRALALDIPLTSFMVFVPIVEVFESIPISIYGLGLRDAGYVFFFKQIGLPNAEASALAVSVLYVMMTAGYAALGGLILANRLLKGRGLQNLVKSQVRGVTSSPIGPAQDAAGRNPRGTED
jgi:glycosyltransferase 2 family protein